MKRRVIVLPLDGYPTGCELSKALGKLLQVPGLNDLIAYIKINDGVHNLDIGGPDMVSAIRNELADRFLPVGIFLDLKILDVSATLENTMKKYLPKAPEILTVSSSCSVDGIIKLRQLLPNTKLAMVSMLTDISTEECQARTGLSPEIKIYNDLQNIRAIYQKRTMVLESQNNPEPFDLIVCSPHELAFLKRNLPDSYGFIVPGIRDEWMKKKDEHQKRVTGVKKALNSGATLVVMGTQITKGNPECDISPAESCRLTQLEIDKAKKSAIVLGDPLQTLINCGGYYKSAQSENGAFLGPLVAYAGTYMTDEGAKNYVGAEYFNFSQAEIDPSVRLYFSDLIGVGIERAGLCPNAVLGAPMGGVLISGDIGRTLNCATIFADKVVISVANLTAGKKEVSEQVMGRHEIHPGDKIIIVEDVCNNFSTTEKLKTLIEEHGGELIGIACAFNRSGKTEWEGLPVISAHFIPTEQFRQDDERVTSLISKGNIAWKVKAEWSGLKSLMLK